MLSKGKNLNLLFYVFILQVGVHLFRTFRANTMTEFSFRVVSDIRLYLIPIPFVIPDLFA